MTYQVVPGLPEIWQHLLLLMGKVEAGDSDADADADDDRRAPRFS